MHGFRIVNGLLLGVALIAPMVLRADDTKQTTTTTRYYDSEGKDYHDWTPNEDHAYRTYLGEQHRDYVEFPKTTVVQQSEYFKWRHGHSDSVIVKSESEHK